MSKLMKRAACVFAAACLAVSAAAPVSAAWQNTQSGWKYTTENGGYAAGGWRMIDGKWYYFGQDGIMKNGWIFDNGKWYYCNQRGEMQTGWVWDGSRWYCLDQSGAMRKGWIHENDKWYYCNQSGQMLYGWADVDGVTYFFNTSGEMQTGVIQVEGKNYEFASNGALVGESSSAFPSAAYTLDGHHAEIVDQAPDGQTVRVTIYEGMSATEIANRLEQSGVCRAEDFLKAINQYQTTSATFGEFKNNQDLFYYYEGCLYPDTYEFYANAAPESVIRKMLINFDNKITDELKEQMEEKGLTLLETITFASVIQQEAGKPEDMAKVSAVFWNRLNNSAQFPLLQSNPTREYVEREVLPHLDWGNSSINTDTYDTYKTSGLPAGPICNPSVAAIEAVLNPEEGIDAYFFCTDKTGKFYFAETLAEHKENIAKAQEVNASLEESKESVK